MKNKKIFLAFVISIVILFVLFIFYFFIHSEVGRLYGEMKTIRENIAEGLAKDKELDLIKSDIKNTLGDYERINSFFVSSDGLVDFIQYVENMGKEAGVSVLTRSVTNKNGSQNNPSENYPEGFKEEIIISFDVYGSLKNNLNFLDLIEHLPYKISVLGASFEKIDQKTTEKDVPVDKNFDYKSNISISVIKSK